MNSFTTAQRVVLSIGAALALLCAALVLEGALTPLSARAQVASTTSPVISSVAASSTADGTGAGITWLTDVPATSQVEYGTTTNYGTFSAFDPATTTSHQVTLGALTPNTTYHFAVLSGAASTTASTTAMATSTSADMTFTTALGSTTVATSTGAGSSTAPVISSILATPSSTSATITWVTDQAADSQVSYGTSTNYTNSTALDSTHVFNHSQTLTGLTPNLTYHFSVMSGNGSTTASSSDQTFTTLMSTTTGTSTATSTTPSGTGGDINSLIAALENLRNLFPQFAGQILGVINQLMAGNTVGNSGSASLDQSGGTFQAGGSIDFGGRNFGHEETVNITLNGQLVTTAHADGGGNFSTGSISLPATPGDYTYTFTGQTSGTTVSEVIHLQ